MRPNQNFFNSLTPPPPASTGDTIMTLELTSVIYFLPVKNSSNTIVVDWGDGSPTQSIGPLESGTQHTYPSIGTYDIKISNLIDRYTLQNGTQATNATTTIKKWGDMTLTFNTLKNNNILSIIEDGSLPTLSDDLSFCFSNTIFTSVPNIIFWDVSSVTNMSDMFSQSVFDGFISNWDVSSVTNMSGMFRDSQFNGHIFNWDVSSVTNMSGMFKDSQFNGDISNWDVSNVTNMIEMFKDSQFNSDISNWDISNVTNMTGMFDGATLDTQIYDDMLINWSNISPKSNVVFSAGSSKYTSAGLVGRNILTNPPYNWTITDGGLEIK